MLSGTVSMASVKLSTNIYIASGWQNHRHLSLKNFVLLIGVTLWERVRSRYGMSVLWGRYGCRTCMVGVGFDAMKKSSSAESNRSATVGTSPAQSFATTQQRFKTRAISSRTHSRPGWRRVLNPRKDCGTKNAMKWRGRGGVQWVFSGRASTVTFSPSSTPVPDCYLLIYPSRRPSAISDFGGLPLHEIRLTLTPSWSTRLMGSTLFMEEYCIISTTSVSTPLPIANRRVSL